MFGWLASRSTLCPHATATAVSRRARRITPHLLLDLLPALGSVLYLHATANEALPAARRAGATRLRAVVGRVLAGCRQRGHRRWSARMVRMCRCPGAYAGAMAFAARYRLSRLGRLDCILHRAGFATDGCTPLAARQRQGREFPSARVRRLAALGAGRRSGAVAARRAYRQTHRERRIRAQMGLGML